MISAMLSGDLDVISNLQAPSSLAQFQDTARYTVVEGTTTGEVTLGFNHSASALANLKVRQAICHAIDRKKLCLLYTSPSPRDRTRSRMPSSA